MRYAPWSRVSASIRRTCGRRATAIGPGGRANPDSMLWRLGRMTWIKIIPPQQAEGKLREAYERALAVCPPEYREPVASLERPDGRSDSIVASHSLLPDALLHSFSAFGAIMGPDLPLTRRQQELIAAL